MSATILIPEPSPIVDEAAGLLVQESEFWPLARFLDIHLSLDPQDLSAINLLVRAIYAPAQTYGTRIHMTLLRSPTQRREVMKRILQEIALLDIRKIAPKQDRPRIIEPDGKV